MSWKTRRGDLKRVIVWHWRLSAGKPELREGYLIGRIYLKRVALKYRCTTAARGADGLSGFCSGARFDGCAWQRSVPAYCVAQGLPLAQRYLTTS